MVERENSRLRGYLNDAQATWPAFVQRDWMARFLENDLAAVQQRTVQNQGALLVPRLCASVELWLHGHKRLIHQC